MRRLLALVLIASSCRLTSDGGVVGVFTPGAAARIEITTTSVAGGHAMILTERVDSARATIEASTCTQSVVGGSCDPGNIPLLRTVTQAQLDAIFGVVTSAEFRAVRPSYRRAGSIIPPDLMQVRLDVTVGERSRTITWERDAVIPSVLNDLRCLVTTAAGSLILCAERP
ncbi:MAG: hypothetical protein H7066_18120 [Cytophagaceae bacterium]|nr:hypothetical protein [Gemmatimonadaceae bacterium]